jgi:hypothetical protein
MKFYSVHQDLLYKHGASIDTMAKQAAETKARKKDKKKKEAEGVTSTVSAVPKKPPANKPRKRSPAVAPPK